MGGPNLEVFKVCTASDRFQYFSLTVVQFGMYVMFPIGIMWYFGTNLDSKFSVDGFWPTKEQSNRVPRERKDLDEELDRLKSLRLNLRQKRLEEDALMRGDFDEVRRIRGE